MSLLCPINVKIRGGLSLLDMKRFVETRGFKGAAYKGLSMEDLLTLESPIVPIDFHGNPHFAVVRGLNTAGEVHLADGRERHENRRDFKARPVKHFVRDEGVAGSNPATPTTFSAHPKLAGPDMGNETHAGQEAGDAVLVGYGPQPDKKLALVQIFVEFDRPDESMTMRVLLPNDDVAKGRKASHGD